MTIKPGYIRVSEILKQWDRFGNVREEVLQRKADLGTTVHEAIKAHHENVPIPLFEGKGYLESFWKWLEASGAEIYNGGQRYYCEKLKITGEIDALVKFPGNEELVLVDWKTSSSPENLFWKLQGQFYIYLCETNGLAVSNRFLFIQLDKDGGLPKAHEFKASSSLMNVCMSAYVCYKYMKKLD